MFCENLRRLRQQSSMTQSEVAKYLNISRVAYTNYELGNREPDFETLKKISDLFKTSTDIILGNNTNNISCKEEITDTYKSDMRINDLPDDLKNIVENYSQLSTQGCEELKTFMEILKVEENVK